MKPNVPGFRSLQKQSILVSLSLALYVFLIPNLSVGKDLSAFSPKSGIIIPSDTLPKQASKWVLQMGDTLFWVIPPTATWDDIDSVREALKKLDVEFNINTLKYDPLQLFITTLVLYVHLPTGQNGTGEEFKDDYTPIKGYTGFVAPRILGMGFRPPEPLLSALKEDYVKALQLKDENGIGFLEDRLLKEFHRKRIFLTYNYLTRNFLENVYASNTLKKEGVGKSPENMLLITELNKDAVFYLNAAPSSMKELSRLPFDRVQKINTGEDQDGKRYIMVYTN